MRKFYWVLLFSLAGKALYANTLPIPAVIYALKIANMASPMAGIIQTAPLKEGQSFKKDQLLVSFMCEKELAMQRKEKAILAQKGETYKGYSRLKRLNAISKLELLNAKAEFQEAKANWDIAKQKVLECYVKAPFDGQIIKKHINPYEHVDMGASLLDIVNLQELEIKIIAPSNWLKWIKKGMVFSIKVQETGKTYKATVSRFNHYVEPVSQTFSIFGTFSKPTEDVMPGMSGQAIFRENK